ncbi:hypothetical protein ACFORG_14250 [Lutimaribacter marinistellae]|uniref:Nickel/cobalt transporter regulator n=1 Tax=Lutimaribacter marinistellae TaxID=1820329 RepID=A0ABV7TI93_9RHOB
MKSVIYAAGLAFFLVPMAQASTCGTLSLVDGTLDCQQEVTAPGQAKRISVMDSRDVLKPGDELPPRAMVMINTAYYGLPPAGGGWWYFETNGEIYRADPGSRRVIERVTHLANSSF